MLSYAPLWPLAYVLTASMLLFTYGCYVPSRHARLESYRHDASKAACRATRPSCVIYACSSGRALGPSSLLVARQIIALRYWYARPPPLNETLMDEFRFVLLLLLMAHVAVVQLVSAHARAPQTSTSWVWDADEPLAWPNVRLIAMYACSFLGFFATQPYVTLWLEPSTGRLVSRSSGVQAPLLPYWDAQRRRDQGGAV